ncbi:MAG: hypothetical protein VB962_13725 [Pseudohongiellaceae bacterium]|jgi:hypothetical protein
MQTNQQDLENLQFIRKTMERSSTVTSVSGIGVMAMGVIGSIGAYLAPLQTREEAWVYTWLAIAALGCVTGFGSTWYQSRSRAPATRLSALRRFGLALAPPILAACVLTDIFIRTGQFELMPGTWMLLYGAGVITAGALSISLIPVMGSVFMLLGAIGLYFADAWNVPVWQHMASMDFYLAAVFGGIHLLFGAIIAVKCNS